MAHSVFESPKIKIFTLLSTKLGLKMFFVDEITNAKTNTKVAENIITKQNFNAFFINLFILKIEN